MRRRRQGAGVRKIALFARVPKNTRKKTANFLVLNILMIKTRKLAVI
jgi:hypothetical protein